MLISALNDYYDILVKQGKALPEGRSEVGISYLISLSDEGKINGIIDVRDKVEKGKSFKLVPKIFRMPKRLETTTVKANIAEHRPAYIFGLSYDKKNGTFVYNEDKKFAAFKEQNIEAVDGIDSPVVNAFRLFVQNWNPENETENVFLKEIEKDYSGSYYAFCLNMNVLILLHEDPALVEKCMQTLQQEKYSSDSVLAQCPVTGKEEVVSRIHNKIKSVRGGQASGTVLVSFKNDSEDSYGKTQSYNSNISDSVMNRYTEALNYLLSARNHHTVIDDTTLIYWACSGNEKCSDIFSMLMFDDNDESITDEDLESIIKDCKDGILTKEKLDNVSLDSDTDFYIAGIKPNSSRLSVKFIYRQKFGRMMMNIAKHQADMKIRNESKPVPLWRVKKELVSPKSKDEAVDPSLMDKFFGAIINGTPYPQELLYTVIRRVKTDSDEENRPYIKMNDIRIGLIKACLIRAFNKKEEFKLALDKENLNQAYLCGRLFAVLEQIQQKASGYSLNRTIKDAYFSSAAARPASVFPKIMKLSQYHLSKIDNPKYFNDDIREITDNLNNEFPLTLPLAEQGKFIIGYYQQSSYNFEKIKQSKEDK